VNPKNARLEAWTSAQYARISELLDKALELAPEAREGWLADLETRDRESAQEIRALLKPGADRIERILTGAEGVIASVPEADWSLVGRQFGPYRVRSLLGHGGMGSVWLAERADGLLERRVALKLVPPALMGFGFAERLARERTILASLDHPNIARLFDAGLSADGQPYLALEYVPGVSFVAYCDQHRLSVPDRLELFRQVLRAVQYAHAHLVIHRDLKPANILVTEEGRVCLLDFGIAKLLQESVANETELTQLRGRALSPKYAAPEQITGGPITIAADIYALGVMLYELLTGEGPTGSAVLRRVRSRRRSWRRRSCPRVASLCPIRLPMRVLSGPGAWQECFAVTSTRSSRRPCASPRPSVTPRPMRSMRTSRAGCTASRCSPDARAWLTAP
jgi:serine/threonine-protein kinase